MKENNEDGIQTCIFLLRLPTLSIWSLSMIKRALIILKMYNVVYIKMEKIISICEANIMFSYPSKLFELKVKHRALDMGIRCRHSIVIVVRSRIEVG